jgi:hypothetical protein
MAQVAPKTTSPWLIGGIAIGAALVFYFLYQEYEASLAAQSSASSSAASTTAATTTADGIVASAIPDQVSTASPSYPATATVTPSGTVTGTSTAEPTGTPAPASPASPTETTQPTNNLASPVIGFFNSPPTFGGAL